jgi:CheY-like chemotaxis protein
MKGNQPRKAATPAGAGPDARPSRPHRILVAEDEPTILELNTRALLGAGYQVDAAKDGAAAWDALQLNHYDLLVTDNSMPKISGVELLHKMHDADMALPVIMATGIAPRDEFDLYPWIRPAAMLCKPYSSSELLGTVKNLLRPLVLVGMFCFFTTATHAQEVKLTPEKSLQSPEILDKPVAQTISVHGKCECSEDGVTFAHLENADVLEQEPEPPDERTQASTRSVPWI